MNVASITTETLNVIDTLQLKEAAATKCHITEKLNVDSLRVDRSASFPGGLLTDRLESDTDTILVNGDLCTCGLEMVKVDNLRATNDSVLFNHPIITDTIGETHTDNGVTVDDVLIKNGMFYVAGTRVETQGNKGVANGYAGLDNNGKIPVGLLPRADLTLVGTWNAETNSPALTSGAGSAGQMYIVSATSGTPTVLDSVSDWEVNDIAMFDGTAWTKIRHAEFVNSVNGSVGVVAMTTSDLPEGTKNKWYTDQRVSENSVVAANSAHTEDTNNPHNVTAAHLGNSIAQWNAGSIRGVPISNVAPSNGQLLGYSDVLSMWTPVDPPVQTTLPRLMLCAAYSRTLPKPNAGPGPGTFGITLSSWGLVSPNLVSFDESLATWVFPETGLYKITWGGSVHYTAGGFQDTDIRINIGPSTVCTVPLQQSNFDVNRCCSGTNVWTGMVAAGETGIISLLASSLTDGTSVIVDNYFIYIEKWV